jgi:hypothetical protein
MSFVLPGNSRSLRFSGEAKALEVEEEAAPASISPPSSLGKPRVRRPSTAPPSIGGRAGGAQRSVRGPLQTPVSTHDVFDSYASAASVRGPIVRHKLHDLDTDGDPTTAMDREADLPPRSVLPVAVPRPASVPTPAIPRPPRLPAIAPRGSTGAAPVVLPHPPNRYPTGAEAMPAGAGAPYLVWLLASLLAGIISYNVAPRIAAHFDASSASFTPGP